MSGRAGIGPAEFARRRAAMMELAGADAILVLPSAAEKVRSRDSTWPFRQDSDFWYLTGFNEPESVLVLVPGRAAGEVILFCREREPAREAWDGPRLGPEDAPDALGVDDAYPIADLDEILPGLIEGRSRVYYHFGRDPEFDLQLIGWVNQVRERMRLDATPPHEFREIGHLLHEQRLIKSAAERRLMRASAEIAVAAHRAALAVVKPQRYEYEIEAELLAGFRRRGAVPAYESIVGSGANACVLHYRANQSRLAAGSLLLVDAGAEFHGYASDITRTSPVSGRFTNAQREIHDLVHAAQAAAIATVRPGARWLDPHRAAIATLTEGLLRLGVLRGRLETALEKRTYAPFYMHKTGHWLGLDVHDVGDYRIDGDERLLEPGMAFTIEPGLYFPAAAKPPARYAGIGVRIEDDVLVTRDGVEVMTAALPSAAEEIAALVGTA